MLSETATMQSVSCTPHQEINSTRDSVATGESEYALRIHRELLRRVILDCAELSLLSLEDAWIEIHLRQFLLVVSQVNVMSNTQW